MLVDTKTVEYIRPDSETDPEAEAYEYYLVWINPDGGVYCWLFQDFERKQEIDGEVINTKSAKITKLYNHTYQTVTLTGEDLTENEFNAISNILRAKIIRRYYRNGNFDPVAIISDSLNFQKSDFRYNFEFEIMEIEKSILK